ncbi:MAG: hypothetical protein M3N41_13560 [Acidobacteriota bacterium]|nr:hypothetical protein [Acidobacteriota bacterium]
MFKTAFRAFRSRLLSPLLEKGSSCDRALLLQGRQACHVTRSLDYVDTLSDAEFGVYSQWGEDGILEWLIQRLPISSKRFIEFGVQDYREANTRFLLINRNWKGLIIDGSSDNMELVRKEELYWRHDLTAVGAFIDRDNIADLITTNGFAGPVGVLSVDIDGNDYWVWEAIECVNADIVVCEYNAVFGDLHPITIPYGQDFYRTAAHKSNLYFGASISAMRLLAKQKGYELAGTNNAGSNAFFVRKDLFPLVESAIGCKEPCPSLARESRNEAGQLNHLSGLDRLREIADMPVVCIDTGRTTTLRALGSLYSDAWLDAMCVGQHSKVYG